MTSSYFSPLGGAVPAAAATFTSSSQLANRDLYNHWFQMADKDKDGRITGPDAVKFFSRSDLPRDLLAKVWAAADHTRRGFLDLNAFIKAMELISLAQSTGVVSLDSYKTAKDSTDIGIPHMKGLHEPHLQHQNEPYTDGFNAPGMPPPLPPLATGNPFTDEHPPPPPPIVPVHQQQQQPSTSSPGAAQYSPPPFGSAQQGGGGAGSPFLMGGNGAFPGAAAAGGTPVFYPPISGPGSTSTTTGVGGGYRKKKVSLTTKDATSIAEGLKKIYFTKIRQLEDMYKFGHFFSPLLVDGDFEAKPSVLLLGQYSTGKTTFIKYLLGSDYPGIHIGPEPTTDRFVVVMNGPEERRTPGNTLVVQPDKPYQGLSQFGNGFLSKFEAAQCENRLLEEVTLVDTPGVLSGEKQRIERTYDFIQVCAWFAARCDLILLLFDPYKLDISDEFKAVISALRGHDDKVRVVLNKSDQVDQQQLMRVYGALMWSLGKVFKSPEVCRVYIGSFNAGNPIRNDVNPSGKVLFEKEQEDLLHDLYDIPSRSCDRKVNEFVKRVRAAKIHFLIVGHLRKQMPYFGQKKAQERLLENLAAEFQQVQREHHLHAGDFPDVNRYREILSAFDISKFPKLDKNMIKQIDDALSVDIPNLIRQMENPYL